MNPKHNTRAQTKALEKNIRFLDKYFGAEHHDIICCCCFFSTNRAINMQNYARDT